MLKTTISTVIVLSLLCCAIRAKATATGNAKQLIEQGEQAVKNRYYGEAIQHFQAAYAITKQPELALKIALCYESLDYPVEAISYYKAYVKHARLTPGERSAIERKLAVLLPRVAKLTVETNIDGAAISVDGRLIGTTPLAPFLVEAGKRKIEARRNGYVMATEWLVVEGGTAPPPLKLVLPVAHPKPRAPTVSPVQVPAQALKEQREDALRSTKPIEGVRVASRDENTGQSRLRFPLVGSLLLAGGVLLGAGLTVGFLIPLQKAIENNDKATETSSGIIMDPGENRFRRLLFAGWGISGAIALTGALLLTARQPYRQAVALVPTIGPGWVGSALFLKF